MFKSYILVKSSNEYSVAIWGDMVSWAMMDGILVYYENMQYFTIVSYRVHILFY